MRHNDGLTEPLEDATTAINAGEAVISQTPTAGGYGEPSQG